VLALAAVLVGPLAAPAEATPSTRWVVKVTDGRALERQPVFVVSDDTFVVEGPAAPSGPGVVWAEPDTTYAAARVPNDPCFTACGGAADGQAELRTVGAPAAWDLTTGSAAVTVAVLDTLADTSHPDLAGKVTAGPDFVTNRCAGQTAAAGHGTAVAGIVGARTDDGRGMAGLGWSTRVLSIGVLDACGIGDGSAIARGIRYAVDNGARIVNLSLAGQGSQVLEDAIAYAQSKGALVVAAAGNDGDDRVEYPAAYAGVVGVAATDRLGQRLSPFSNFGATVDLAAPGQAVLSAAPGGRYGQFTGTSFAAPMVSATAALLLARHPEWNGADAAVRIQRSARRVAGMSLPLLDAGAAMEDGPGGVVEVSAAGGAYAFGTATFRGSVDRPNTPIVGAAGAGGGGYWMVGSDGGVFSFGAPFFGSTGAIRLNQPIVGMASTPSHQGYWLVAGDGGIFSFGDARFFGSTGAIRLNQPIVGMAATATGRGYYLVARDGGIFTFGDARFSGSMGGRSTQGRIVGMAVAGPGAYWLVGEWGYTFAFGGAPSYGNPNRAGLPPVTGIAAGPGGYWLSTRNGELLAFGAVVDDGSVHPAPASPIVGLAAT
jgi:subtilisin family serine protease